MIISSKLTAAHIIGSGSLIFSHVGGHPDAQSLHFAFGPHNFTPENKIICTSCL